MSAHGPSAVRLDIALSAAGLARSRAAEPIGSGRVRVEGATVLRADPRVNSRAGHHLREPTLCDLGGHMVEQVVGDVSFISLKLLPPTLPARNAGIDAAENRIRSSPHRGETHIFGCSVG